MFPKGNMIPEVGKAAGWVVIMVYPVPLYSETLIQKEKDNYAFKVNLIHFLRDFT